MPILEAAKEEESRARRHYSAHRKLLLAIRDVECYLGPINELDDKQRADMANIRIRADYHLLACLYAAANYKQLTGHNCFYMQGWLYDYRGLD